MKILITGGTGFIGREVVKIFDNKKNKILILTRKSLKNSKNKEFFKCNFFNPKSYKSKIKIFNPDIVIHCFWFGIPELGKKNSNLNYKYSKIFFQQIKKLDNIKKIIVSGSCFEVKNKRNLVSEKCEVNRNDYFSEAKIKIYKYLKDNIKNNQKLYWLRIFYAYGPMQRKDSIIPYLIKSIKKNKKVSIKNPNNSLDFIYVKDVARYFKKIISINPTSGIYNVGSGKGIKLVEIFKILVRIIDNNYKFRLPDNSQNALNFFSSSRKTIKKVFWKPKYSILTGLKQTVIFK